MRLWVEQLPDSDKDLWNEWVSSHPDAHFYHLWEWGDVLSATYDYQRFYLVIKCKEGIMGALPLVYIRSRIFKSKLVSLPFCEYGGPLLADSSGSSVVDGAIRLFLKAVRKLTRKIKVDYLEMRQPPSPLSTFGFSPLERYLTFRVNLTQGEAQVWRNMDKKCRTAIRKAAKSGVRTLSIDEEHMKHYYNLYVDTQKKHGSPPHSEALFTNIFDVLKKKGLAQILLAVYDGRPIGGIIVFCFNRKIYWWNNVTDRKHRSLNPTNFLLWHIIKWGETNNFRTLDLGRTRVETKGIYHFKSGWGGQRVSLKDYVLTTKKTAFVDPSQQKYATLSKMWSNLPSVLAQRLGPNIVSEIGL